ncbi:hypothetical protein R6Q59_027486 [Mikania micrantha]
MANHRNWQVIYVLETNNIQKKCIEKNLILVSNILRSKFPPIKQLSKEMTNNFHRKQKNWIEKSLIPAINNLHFHQQLNKEIVTRDDNEEADKDDNCFEIFIMKNWIEKSLIPAINNLHFHQQLNKEIVTRDDNEEVDKDDNCFEIFIMKHSSMLDQLPNSVA